MKHCIFLLTHEFVNGEILCKSCVLYPIFGPVYMFLCSALSIVFLRVLMALINGLERERSSVRP